MQVRFGIRFYLPEDRFRNKSGNLDEYGRTAMDYFRRDFFPAEDRARLETQYSDDFTMECRRIPAELHHYGDIRDTPQVQNDVKDSSWDVFELRLRGADGKTLWERCNILTMYDLLRDRYLKGEVLSLWTVVEKAVPKKTPSGD